LKSNLILSNEKTKKCKTVQDAETPRVAGLRRGITHLNSPSPEGDSRRGPCQALWRNREARLNQQVTRNQERFPADFTFQLNSKEHEALRLQFATSKKTRGGRRYPPYAFTEHGAIMAATVLNSARAVQMSVFVVRAFVRLREMLATNRRLAGKINELENRLDTHDSVIQELIEAIKELMTPKEPPRSRIGFQLPSSQAKG
jgi:phage regulator Rha-like protein